MKNIIEVKNLTKEYKKIKAVDNLSFDVKEGEILGLLGPNGSGKSTTINCILSLLNYQNGDIKVFGEEMNPDSYSIKSKIGVIFQEVAVFEELTVYENIDYFCGLYISDKVTRSKYVEDAIDFVGLNEFKKFYPKQLSGGLLRRLNIACGIAHKPKLIFLDEPTVAVDPQSRNNILDGIKRLRDNGATILYTTHYMEEVEMLCDRIIILDKGKIIAQGTSDELKGLANIEEKITVEINDIDDKLLDEINNFKNVCDVSLNINVLQITYKKGENNLGELMEYLKNKKSINKIEDIMHTTFEPMELDSFETRTRAFVKVQDGCNNFCSYCIIPYTRGNIRSKEKEDVVNEIKCLVKNNYKEVVLTGIHTGHYGKDRYDYDFSDLLSELCKIDGLERIRISSIEITAPQT